MKQWKLLIAVAMLLAFAAGTIVGVGRGRMHPASPDAEQQPGDRPDDGPDFGHGPHGRGHGGGPPEANMEALSLNPAQRAQVRAIWEALLQDGPRLDEERREIQSRCRAKADALLTPEQKKQYDALMADYAAEMGRYDRTRRGNFEEAVAKTKALLTPEQREKYEQLLARHHGPGDPGGPGRHGPGGPDDHGDGGPHHDDDHSLFGPPDSFGPRHESAPK